jgi:HD-GYP domain-containing protein (c-di-GMP phosphodiesterase class II)
VSWALGATIAVAVAAGAGAALASSTAGTVACLVVLAVGAAAVGWLAGEQHRTKLQSEIEARSLELRKTMTELEVAQAETVRRLSMAVEFRDEDTGAHIERIGRFSTLLAEQIGLEQELCERMSHAAPLHDVGKVAIPDAILLKPGKLTAEERAIVETHAEEGHRLLKGSSSAILDMAATIALSHHEKWDGSGYPRGVAGESIPIEGRVVAIADVFDALTSDRVYRKAFSVQEAVQMMREERGKHFDPVLLDAFMEVLEQSGPDAREQVRADPAAVAESALETFATALERGEAEPAETAIAQAMEDGLGAGDVQGEVIEPTLRRLAELRERGQLDAEHEQLAMTIVRRVLATLRRYLLSGREDEDVLERIERSVEQVEQALRAAAVG